jgi:outer membrane beta-barrel protein
MKKIFIPLFIYLFSFISFSYAGERSVYEFSWLDKDKEIYVLQNRVYRKDGRLYFGGAGATTVSGAFVDSYGAQARVGYFFREDWGFEFVYGKNSGKVNDTGKAIEAQAAVPFYRKIDSYNGLMLMWSPFYAKINSFNQIFYFDWMFGAGLANLKTLDNREKFNSIPSSTLTEDSATGLIWTTAVRFHLNQNWSLRMDFSGLHFSADRSRSSTSAEKARFSNFDFALGLNYAI